MRFKVPWGQIRAAQKVVGRNSSLINRIFSLLESFHSESSQRLRIAETIGPVFEGIEDLDGRFEGDKKRPYFLPKAKAYTMMYPDHLQWLMIQGCCRLSRVPDKPHVWKKDRRLLWTLWNDYLENEKFADFCAEFVDPKGRPFNPASIQSHTGPSDHPHFDRKTEIGLKRLFAASAALESRRLLKIPQK